MTDAPGASPGALPVPGSRSGIVPLAGRVALAWLLLLALPLAGAQPFLDRVRADYASAYGGENLLRGAGVLAVGGLLANSDADQEIREFWQDELRGETADDLMSVFEDVGNIAHPLATLPIYGYLRYRADRHGQEELFTFADRSLRALFLTVPQDVVLRNLLGSPRPPDGPSDWDPFGDEHGVSGHALYGAIPFLTWARMVEDPWARAALWGLSAMPGLSRVHRDRHYFSQFAVGWGLAWQATRVIERVDLDRAGGAKLSFAPVGDGAMVVMHWRWR